MVVYRRLGLGAMVEDKGSRFRDIGANVPRPQAAGRGLDGKWGRPGVRGWCPYLFGGMVTDPLATLAHPHCLQDDVHFAEGPWGKGRLGYLDGLRHARNNAGAMVTR